VCEGKIHTNPIQKSMKKPTLDEILKVASFEYDEDGNVALTRLDAHLIGDHHGDHRGDHYGTHRGDHYGTHRGDHYGYHAGKHQGKTYNTITK